MPKEIKRRKRGLTKRQIKLMKQKRQITRLSLMILGILGLGLLKESKDYDLKESKAIISYMEDSDYLLTSYGTSLNSKSRQSEALKKVFSDTSFAFVSITNDEISNELLEEVKSSNKKIGLIVTPTDYTYESIYKTIDKIKEIVKANKISCPILYDISKYMNDDVIRANCLLAEEFCNKLSANGCYVGIAGSTADIEAFSSKFIQVTKTHSLDLYDKMIYLEDNNLSELSREYDGNYNMVRLRNGIVLWKTDLSKIIEDRNLNNSTNFIDEYTYTIKSGDCLEKIAENYNMKVDDLAGYNGINSDKIYPGAEIVIPNNYTCLSKDTIDNIDEEQLDEIIKSESLNRILKGIDVSHHQGDIDWDLVKEEVDFAILRLCDFYYATDEENCLLDKKFIYNMTSCEEKNIPVGVYYYSRATDEESARTEAQFVASKLKEYSLEYPVYMDAETAYLNELMAYSPKEFKKIARAAMEVLEENGYYAGIYCSRTLFKNIQDLSEEYTFWLTSNNTFKDKVYFDDFYEEDFPVLYTPNNNVSIYQHSECGKIDGIKENVDIDYATSILPKIVEEKGYTKIKK